MKVDADSTHDTLEALPLLRGRLVEKGDPGFKIEFIGPGGEVLKTRQGLEGRYPISPAAAYARVKVTFTRKHPTADALEEYYAWGQPVFTDNRAAPEPGL